MNILPIQNNTTSFKSGFPVVHWVKDGTGTWAPAITQVLNQKLQSKLVRMLNCDVRKAKADKAPIIQKFKTIVLGRDADFANNPISRSYYNSQGGWSEGSFEPFGYILTGHHAEYMTESLGKDIGRAKSNAPRLNDKLMPTAEVNIAVNDYVQQGLTYVKKLASHFRGANNIKEVLHTKFEVIRTKTGKIKDIRFVDAKFCPENGPDNPFARMGYSKK